MEILYNKLLSCNFVRTNVNLCTPLVVHCVAGAGKSTLIRELLSDFDIFTAYTLGVADPKNLEGRRIKGLDEFDEDDKRVLILDEYLAGAYNFEPLAVFADPYQYRSGHKEAHFICYNSRRFGFATSEFLRKLNFQVYAEKQDNLLLTEIFKSELEGVNLYYEDCVGSLLKAHQLECYKYCEVKGLTFDTVTFVTAEDYLKEEDRHKAYVCMTRHRNKLIIKTPNATYSAARLL